MRKISPIEMAEMLSQFPMKSNIPNKQNGSDTRRNISEEENKKIREEFNAVLDVELAKINVPKETREKILKGEISISK